MDRAWCSPVSLNFSSTSNRREFTPKGRSRREAAVQSIPTSAKPLSEGDAGAVGASSEGHRDEFKGRRAKQLCTWVREDGKTDTELSEQGRDSSVPSMANPACRPRLGSDRSPRSTRSPRHVGVPVTN